MITRQYPPLAVIARRILQKGNSGRLKASELNHFQLVAPLMELSIDASKHRPFFGSAMSTPNFKSMSVDTLLAMREEIDGVLAERVEIERRELSARMARLDRFYPSKRDNASRPGPLPPKYCNPNNPQETWAGRGRIPRWMAPALKAGKKKDDFRIEKVLRGKEGRSR